jgi:hypothetical protein
MIMYGFSFYGVWIYACNICIYKYKYVLAVQCEGAMTSQRHTKTQT